MEIFFNLFQGLQEKKTHLLIDRSEQKVRITIYYTHKMILVLSSDGVGELGLVCDIMSVPVHIDGWVSVGQVVRCLVVGEVFTEIRCRGQVIQLVGHQTEDPRQEGRDQ